MNMSFADQSFDAVYSLGLLEHFSPAEQVLLLREQARVAKKAVLVEVPAYTPHLRAMLWVNRTLFIRAECGRMKNCFRRNYLHKVSRSSLYLLF
jgi:ubiquinone/menaquinone biosynthesis C-methylase UbiE